MSQVIEHKRQMLALWQSGAFGNKLRSWSDLAALKASGYAGYLSVRTKRGKGNGPTYYNTPGSMVEDVLWDLALLGIDEREVYFNETAPDDQLITQGELVVDWIGTWQLLYSEEKTRMNYSVRSESAKSLSGISARHYLQSRMTPSSWDDMKELTELYPDAAIEFSVYRHNLGDCRGRNTIIWEVRNY